MLQDSPLYSSEHMLGLIWLLYILKEKFLDWFQLSTGELGFRILELDVHFPFQIG